MTSEIKVTQHDDDEDIVRTKANLIIYEGIRILNPKPKPDEYDCIRILYRLYVFYSIYIFITWDVVSSN